MNWQSAGWQVFPPDPGLTRWIDAVAPTAAAITADPLRRTKWLRHGGTWFAGVDVLPNDAQGRVGNGPALHCAALTEAGRASGALPLHPAQVSVTYPGYPRQDPDETDAAHRYRVARDAAHVDGLLPIGDQRRRMIREPHAWILGLPLTDSPAGRAPLVVWEGSQHVMRRALRAALAPHAPVTWPDVDVTEAYHAARREVFSTCRRVEVTAARGQAVLVHRLALHGVAPWREAPEPGACRTIAYVRPLLPGGIGDWLTLP